jgi:hypothetical protein
VLAAYEIVTGRSVEAAERLTAPYDPARVGLF